MYYLRMDGKVIQSNEDQNVLLVRFDRILALAINCEMPVDFVEGEEYAMLITNFDGSITGISVDDKEYHGVHMDDVEFIEERDMFDGDIDMQYEYDHYRQTMGLDIK